MKSSEKFHIESGGLRTMQCCCRLRQRFGFAFCSCFLVDGMASSARTSGGPMFNILNSRACLEAGEAQEEGKLNCFRVCEESTS